MNVHELPNKLLFTMYSMHGEIFSFECRDSALWMAWDEKQRSMFATPRCLMPDEYAWSTFWSQINVIGVWYWRKEYLPRDMVILDGLWWRLEISHQGRTQTCSGNNAYPPDDRLEPSEAFKQLLRAFGRLCTDEQFVKFWYYGEVIEPQDGQ